MKENHPGYKTQAMRAYRQKVRIARQPEREEKRRQKELARLAQARSYQKQNLFRRFRTMNRESWFRLIRLVFSCGTPVYAQFSEAWAYGKIIAHINLGDSHAVRVEFENCILDYDYHLLDPEDGLVRLGRQRKVF
jgi:hypothetical protein